MTAVATTCWTVKVASASRVRMSSGDCCCGATTTMRQRLNHPHATSVKAAGARHEKQGRTYILRTW